MLKAKLGMSPIAWWNDDLPELSDDVSLEECLRQSRSAGFPGMEKGRRFPDDPQVLLPILKAADAPCSVYGEVGRSIQGDLTRPLATKPKLSDDEMKAYAGKLTAFGEW